MNKENHNPVTVPYVFVKARYQFLINKSDFINMESSSYPYVYNVALNSIAHPDEITEEILIEFADRVGVDYSPELKESIRDHYCSFRINLLSDYMNIHGTFFNLFTLVLDDDATQEEKENVAKFKQHGAKVYKEMVEKFINCGII